MSKAKTEVEAMLEIAAAIAALTPALAAIAKAFVDHRVLAAMAMQNMATLGVDSDGKPKPGNRAELVADFAVGYATALNEKLERPK